MPELEQESIRSDAEKLLSQIRRKTDLIQEGEVRSELSKIEGFLSEALSSADWAKIGTVLGILWSRFERLIGSVDRLGDTARGIETNTRSRR